MTYRRERRARRLITYVWIMASMALPAIGVGLAFQGLAAPTEALELTHHVATGETLTAIATRYNVSVQEIVQANGLSNPNMIYAGQMLVIPRAVDAGGGRIHEVQAGETLSAIGRRYGFSADTIAQANGLDSVNRIYAGQRLLIPGTQSQPSVSAAAESAPATVATTSVTHTVRQGDTLYRISLIYGVPVDDLISANALSNPNALYTGQLLRVPSVSSSGVRTHVVRSGETLASIAIEYNTTVDNLIATNGITNPSRIYPGQVLNISAAGAAARTYPAQAATSHTVRQGETLGEIALRYGVGATALAAANGITNSGRIYPGQVLSIPGAAVGSASTRYASYGPGLCEIQIGHGGSGYFIRPARRYIISQYFHPWHPGIDLAMPTGSNIYAMDGGTVVYAGWNPAGYGNLVILDHGEGWRTYYAHLSQVYVNCGDWVPRGSIIAASGNTGNSTGPHLHFELLKNGTPVNPAGYISF